MSDIIQSLWIGGSLTKMEHLCLKSFADNGHTVHLYTYGDVGNIPNNVIVKDGNSIVPKDKIFTYKNGSYSAFSNFFRFTLLCKKGGYWIDADLLCVKPFKLNQDIVIAGEPSRDYTTTNPTSFMIKLPKGSEIAKEGVKIQEEHKKLILSGEMEWGSGPATIKHLVEKFNLHKYILPWKSCCSCFYDHFHTIVEPKSKLWIPGAEKAISNYNNIPNEMICIHLWNEKWRRVPGNTYNKNNTFHKDSLYEYFKRKHSIN
jgi:hypothetical protein